MACDGQSPRYCGIFLQIQIWPEIHAPSNKTLIVSYNKCWSKKIYINAFITFSYTSLKNNETTCSAPWPTVMRGYFARNNSPAFCTLLAPSKNTRSTMPVHLRLCSSCFPYKLAISGLIMDAMCDASFFPPRARWLVQSAIPRSAKELFTPAAKTFRRGIVLMVAPSPKTAMPNVVASLNSVFICSFQFSSCSTSRYLPPIKWRFGGL